MAAEPVDRSKYWTGWIAWTVAGALTLLGVMALLSIGVVFLALAAPLLVLGILSWRHPSQLLGLVVGAGLGVTFLGALQASSPRQSCSSLYNAADAAAFCPQPNWGGWIVAGLTLAVIGLATTVWTRRAASAR